MWHRNLVLSLVADGDRSSYSDRQAYIHSQKVMVARRLDVSQRYDDVGGYAQEKFLVGS